MKRRLTSVQLAILDTKQLRAIALCTELDQIQVELADVLGATKEEADHLETASQLFLAGACTPADFVRHLGIEVES